MPSEKIHILIIDSSAQTRLLLRNIFEETHNMVVIGEARSANTAVREAIRLKPDIIIIDMDMPDMDGCELTSEILESLPVPIIIVSKSDSSSVYIKALQAGALDYVITPDIKDNTTFESRKKTLINSVLCMSEVKVVARRMDKFFKKIKNSKDTPIPHYETSRPKTKHLVAIGVSTGGPPLIAAILTAIRSDLKYPICIVQHISGHFTDSMVSWLATQSVMPVLKIEEGMEIKNGYVYIAPGGVNTIISPEGCFRLSPPSGLLKPTPSVNEFFFSVSKCYGADATAILLTGMGNDGAEGLKELYDCGACTITQDKESCVVYGMPDAGKKLGAAKYEMTPHQIILYLNSLQ